MLMDHEAELQVHMALLWEFFLNKKLENKPFTVVGTGNQSRDFIHVNDVVKAFLRAGEQSL